MKIPEIAVSVQKMIDGDNFKPFRGDIQMDIYLNVAESQSSELTRTNSFPVSFP